MLAQVMSGRVPQLVMWVAISALLMFSKTKHGALASEKRLEVGVHTMSYQNRQMLLLSHGMRASYFPAKLGVGMLRSDYKAMDRPSRGTDKADVVTISAKLVRIETVSEVDNAISAELLLVLKWKDQRLSGIVGKDEPPQRVDIMQVWTPGMSLSNAAETPEILSEGVHLAYDGTVTLVRDILFTATVAVDVHMFPFDVQSMELLFECPDYDGSEVTFLVDATHSTTEVKSEAVWLVDQYTVAQDMRKSLINGEPDSYIVVTISVRRLFGMACVTLVSPLFIITNFSFVAFFVYIGDFGTRVGIVSTGFLTMVAFLFVINDHLPDIAYWTWLHQYMFMSIISVLVVLIEVVFVHYLDPQNEAADAEKEDPIRLTLKRDKTLLVDKQVAEEGLRSIRGGFSDTDKADGRSGSGSEKSGSSESFISDKLLHVAVDAYNNVDSDRSGVIDVHELMAAMIHLDYPGVTVKLAQETIANYNFDRVDKEGGERMSRAEFIAFVADSKEFQTRIETMQEKESESILCGMDASHAGGINRWSKRVVPLAYLAATVVMLFVAGVFSAHKRGEHSVRAEMALAGREVAPNSPSAFFRR